VPSHDCVQAWIIFFAEILLFCCLVQSLIEETVAYYKLFKKARCN
jgi:hypothetical protein